MFLLPIGCPASAALLPALAEHLGLVATDEDEHAVLRPHFELITFTDDPLEPSIRSHEGKGDPLRGLVVTLC